MNDNKKQTKIFNNWISESQNIVFFGGAGVSTESGIPDFRSKDGLYNQQYKYPPEIILSHSFFMQYIDEFYKFYKSKMFYLDAKPNSTHIGLAKLENQGKLKAIITQNIDGLHQLAGSKNVLELHGSINRNYCMKCNKLYDANFVFNSVSTPRCVCGSLIKPDVVLYEEGLDSDVISKSIAYIENAEMLIVGGTSLEVYPAAGLLDYYMGKKLVLINKSSTPYDTRANLLLQGNLEDYFNFFI